MADILNKDPTFNPIGVRGSLSTLHTGNSDEEGEDDSNPPPPEKKQAISAEENEDIVGTIEAACFDE